MLATLPPHRQRTESASPPRPPALRAEGRNLYPYRLHLAARLPPDLGLQPVHQTRRKLEYPAAAGASYVDMGCTTLQLVVVLGPIDVKQVQFVDEPMRLQQRKGAVDGRSVYAHIFLPGKAQYVAGVQMTGRVLDNTNDEASLPGQPDTLFRQPCCQIRSVIVSVHALTTCDSIATALNYTLQRGRLSRGKLAHANIFRAVPITC